VSIVLNGVTNPSGETATTGHVAVPGTGGAAAVTNPTSATLFGSKVIRCTWSTASTAAGGGDYIEVDVATAGWAVGDVVSFGVFHVLSSIATRLQLSVEFRTSSATISTSVQSTQKQTAAATVYGSGTAPDPAFKLEALTIPATCTKVRIRVLSVAGTGYANWSIGSYLQLDGILGHKGATLLPYFDGATGPAYGWNGTANASTSAFYTPQLTLTPIPDMAPVPRVQITLSDPYPRMETVTLYRIASNRQYRVRGWVDRVAAGGVSDFDFEPPFRVAATYSAEMFDANGVSLGFTGSFSTTVDYAGTVIHQPMDPSRAAIVEVMGDSADQLVRPFQGELARVQGRTLPVWVGNGRAGLSGMAFTIQTEDPAVDAAVASVFGDYDDDQVPVICIRSSLPVGWPNPLFFAVQAPARYSPDGYISDVIRWDLKGDEAAPPAEAIVTALLTYADIEAAFSDYASLEAAYLTYLAMESDFSLVGTAP
jgi:hypothetical protein